MVICSMPNAIINTLIMLDEMLALVFEYCLELAYVERGV